MNAPRSPAPSQIDDAVALGLGTTDQHIAVRRCIERVGPIAHGSGDEPGLTSVAHPGPARPSHRYVARFGKLEQALKPWPPGDIETTPGERDQRSGAGSPGWHVGRPSRRRSDPR